MSQAALDAVAAVTFMSYQAGTDRLLRGAWAGVGCSLAVGGTLQIVNQGPGGPPPDSLQLQWLRARPGDGEPLLISGAVRQQVQKPCSVHLMPCDTRLDHIPCHIPCHTLPATFPATYFPLLRQAIGCHRASLTSNTPVVSSPDTPEVCRGCRATDESCDFLFCLLGFPKSSKLTK